MWNIGMKYVTYALWRIGTNFSQCEIWEMWNLQFDTKQQIETDPLWQFDYIIP